MDIWDLIKVVVGDWKVIATIAGILSAIVGIMIRFNTLEQKVLTSTGDVIVKKKWWQKSIKTVPTKCEKMDTCNELKEFIEGKFDSLHGRIETMEGSISDLSRKQDQDRLEFNAQIGKIEGMLRSAEADKEEASVRTRLLLRGVTASLEGLLEQGCNGPVKNALKELDEYRDKRASQ